MVFSEVYEEMLEQRKNTAPLPPLNTLYMMTAIPARSSHRCRLTVDGLAD